MHKTLMLMVRLGLQSGLSPFVPDPLLAMKPIHIPARFGLDWFAVSRTGIRRAKVRARDRSALLGYAALEHRMLALLNFARASEEDVFSSVSLRVPMTKSTDILS